MDIQKFRRIQENVCELDGIPCNSTELKICSKMSSVTWTGLGKNQLNKENKNKCN